MSGSDGVAAYQRIATELRSRIARGTYLPDDRLPSLAELQAEFGVSNTVIKSALAILRNEDLIVGQQGKGVYVRSDVTPGAVRMPVDVAALAAQVAQLQEQVGVLAERVAVLEDSAS
ncbi:winged helix-turn-helix domain-containing protein [Streptomyces sp. SID3343]|uniref:GntR family transcriptional regulator n=1 Tax=Streptomyces sp. SID3343 TaxID=2690260 RepID=UPI0013696503|nr:GntR family transcriptional regulator [Streptomyces sp. SID3343]